MIAPLLAAAAIAAATANWLRAPQAARVPVAQHLPPALQAGEGVQRKQLVQVPPECESAKKELAEMYSIADSALSSQAAKIHVQEACGS